jgi:hypothetical protein
MKNRSIFWQPSAKAAARVRSTASLPTANFPLRRRISWSCDSIVICRLHARVAAAMVAKKSRPAGKNVSTTRWFGIAAAPNNSKKRSLRAIPPMRGSCTRKMGAREKEEISFASATSFSGERSPGWLRPTTDW